MDGRGILHLSSEFFIRSPTKDIIMRILFKTSFVLSLSFFLFHSGADAQIFEKLNGPYGGGGKVYEGKNGVLFQIFSDSYQNKVMYKSLNDGSSWTKVNLVPSALEWDVISVGLDGVLFLTHGDKLYRSGNDGLSWSAMNIPNSPITAVNSLPDGTIVIATYDNVYQSSNGGQSWNTSLVSNIKYFFYNSLKDEVFAVSNSTIYKSNDKGLTWSMFYSDDFGYEEKDMVVAVNGMMLFAGTEFIWKFDSAGVFLKKLNPVLNSRSVCEIALSTAGRLFTYKNNKSFYSDNLGESWFDIIVQGSNKNYFKDFAADKNGTVFGVRETGSLFKSTDNGKNWDFTAYGINHAVVTDIEFITDSRFISSTVDGLFYTDDDGKNWSFLLEAKSVAPNGTNQVIAHFGEEIYYTGYNEIYYFKDWKSQPVVIRSKQNTAGIDKIIVNKSNGNLYSAEFTGLFRSNDKGKSWTNVRQGVIYDLYIFPDASMILTSFEGLFKSTDNGLNWGQVYAYTLQYDLKIMGNGFSSAHVFLHGGNSPYNIITTVDNGTTWETKEISGQNASLIAPAFGEACNNLDQIYVTGISYNEIYKSVDFGKTYSVFSKEMNSISGLEFSPNQKLYVLSFKDGLYRSKISTSSDRILTGNVFRDLNKNCVKDNGESNLPKILVEGITGNVKQYGYTNNNGDFRMPVLQGDYEFSVSTNNNTWKTCNKSISSSTYNFNDTLFLGMQVNSLCPFMTVDIQSTILRRCVESNIFIDYSNTGTLKATNAYVDVTLDPFFEFISSTIPFSNQTGNVYRFLLGDIDENGSGSFSIKVKVSCNAQLGQIHCAEAHIYPDTPCVQSARALIRTAVSCLGDSIELIIRNDGTKDMAAAKNWWVVDLSKSNSNIQSFDGGTFYLSAGQMYTKKIASRSRVLFIAEQDESYPYNKTSRTEIISCTQNPLPGSPPLNISNLDEEEPYLSKFCERNRGSFDPNDITGYPEGITDKRFIDNEQQLDYVIRFQNTGTDTAFNIRIEDQIPTKELDLATLSLGASSHPYQFILSPEGKLIFSFSNVLLPDSNINEAASHGFVQYSIKPIDKLSNGTKILNDALIYFDFNDGVNTNVDLHTIGSPIPVKVNEVNNVNEIDFTIEPNPMTEYSTISIHAKSKNEQFKLSCLDVHSRQMWEMDVKGNRAAIQKGDMKPGVYFLVLKSRSGLTLKSKKLIID